jgi:hypothetical protein
LPYSDKQWLSFFTAVGRPEMMEMPSFATYSARVHTVDDLYGFVATVTPEKTTAEWVEICERGEIPCMPVADIQTLMDDEHLKAVGMFEPHHHPSEGATVLVRPPVTFSESPADIRRHAPLFGEHSQAVARELGYDEASIADLLASGRLDPAGVILRALSYLRGARTSSVCLARNSSTAFFAAGWCSGSFQSSMSVAFGASAGDLSRRGLWMVQIIAQQYQQGRLTARDKLARHVEEKLAAVHGLLEGFPGRPAHLGARGPELIRPAVEHLEEGLAIVVQADGLKHDGRCHALRRRLDQPHDVWTANAHSRHVEAIFLIVDCVAKRATIKARKE